MKKLLMLSIFVVNSLNLFAAQKDECLEECAEAYVSCASNSNGDQNKIQECTKNKDGCLVKCK